MATKKPQRRAEGGLVDRAIGAAKKGAQYVNDSLNPLTSKATKAKAAAAVNRGRNTATLNGGALGGELRKKKIDAASR